MMISIIANTTINRPIPVVLILKEYEMRRAIFWGDAEDTYIEPPAGVAFTQTPTATPRCKFAFTVAYR
jgi:hypothetical protein